MTEPASASTTPSSSDSGGRSMSAGCCGSMSSMSRAAARRPPAASPFVGSAPKSPPSWVSRGRRPTTSLGDGTRHSKTGQPRWWPPTSIRCLIPTDTPMKPIATLVLLIALLAVLGDAATRPDARVAAQDTPAAPGGTPVVAAAVVEPTATTEPTTEPHPEGTRSAGPAVTTTPTAAEPTAEPTAMPEPSPTPEPWATEMPPPGETAAETAAATPGAASVAPVVPATEQTALTLTVAGDAVSFGQVSATGELDPAI